MNKVTCGPMYCVPWKNGWPMNARGPADWARIKNIQEFSSPEVVTEDVFKEIQKVCGVDVAYRDEKAFAAAVTVDARSLQIIEHVISITKITAPYIPGLMMLRESEPVISAIKKLKEGFDLLMVDANGRLHPRKFGMACHLGTILDKPTIGVAKSLLCGEVEGDSVKLDGELVARIIGRRKRHKIFVSIGNKISLTTASRLTRSMIKEGEWLPEPLRLADRYSKQAVCANYS